MKLFFRHSVPKTATSFVGNVCGPDGPQPPGGLYLRKQECLMFAGAGDRHEPALSGAQIDDVTTAQSGVADVALTLTYGNP
jgi:hypothetical protein